MHPAHAHFNRPERYATDQVAFPAIKETGLKTFHGYLKQIDEKLAGREWFSDRYTVVDPYGFVFYTWGVRRELPMAELKNYTAFKDRMMQRPAVQRVVEQEKVKLLMLCTPGQRGVKRDGLPLASAQFTKARLADRRWSLRPAEPLLHCPAHHPVLVFFRQEIELLGEVGDALPVGGLAEGVGDVGAPVATLRSEGVEQPLR